MGRDAVWLGDIPVLILFCLIGCLSCEEGDEGTRVKLVKCAVSNCKCI